MTVKQLRYTTMDATQKGQVTQSAADVYEEFFVPALFHEWAARVSDAAAIDSGQRVLDVACGTGVLTRNVAERVRPGGVVIGLDCNEGMLDVARHTSPAIEWRLGQAESLPFPEGSFDAVVSQFGLMFFEDRVASLREMWRVLQPGGRLVVAVWDSLDRVPGYAAMTALLQRLFGDRVTDACGAPFILGDVEALLPLFASADISNAQNTTRDGMVHFPSIEAWAHTDVKGWTLADMIDDAQYEMLLGEALKELKHFVQSDGTVAFPSSAHIVTADKDTAGQAK